jgi:ER degradation enhancer, mannosidase alpha-like 2
MSRKFSFSAILGSFVLFCWAGTYGQPVTPEMAKNEFRHAWQGYMRYARGHDALKPLSKQPHDWYNHSLLMTPVDAFDTMLLMGLTTEAAEAKQMILDSLSFDRDMEVQSFEITIRLLGGLLSAYQMDGDRRFLTLAEDLGRRLLPIYNSRTGMPYRYVNLKTGAIRDSINNPAEIGTALLEFGTLSRLTGNDEFYQKPKAALVRLFDARSSIGLVGTWINVETGEWTNTSSHIGGAIDSYYEYLIKAWILFGDEDCLRMYTESMQAVNRYLPDSTANGLWYGRVDMNTGVRTATVYGSLETFMPAMLILGGDTVRARQLQESGLRMWKLHGIEPEQIDYSSMTVTHPQYYLRPEIIESAYYLLQATGDARYREMGETFFHALVKYCRTEAGYAYLDDVATKKEANGMESFFFAETLKYLYLLSDPTAIDFSSVIFTTEAHPLRRSWKQ